MSMPCIFILDDNDDFRESTAFLLEAMGFQVIQSATYEPLLTAMNVIDVDQPSCLLLDIRMPEISGLDVHDIMLKRDIDLPVIYMTAHGDVPLAVAAMSKGALTFLEKPLQDDQLTEALQKALSDEVQSTRLSAADRQEQIENRRKLETLTPRERQVADQIVNELSNKMIARELEISVKTVELHRSRAMHKLEVKNAAHLVRILLSCQE